MIPVEIKQRSLWQGSKRIPLVSGEVHYWRVPQSVWPAIFAGARQLGLKTLSSYTAWHVHEYERGRFDFSGVTSEKTNLQAYLEAVAAAGFYLALRPGPYIFAEWDNYGIPDYVTPFHRLHPEFKRAAAAYIGEVCAVARPFLATNGGPIVMLQADNMFDLGKDRYDTDLGLRGGEGPFQEFLRERYATISDLNAVWGSGFGDFAETMSVTTLPDPSLGMRRRYLDYLEFRDWYTTECALWTVDTFRRHGIDVPIYSNATRDQAPERMQGTLDFMGINFYPTEGYRGVGEHRRLLDDVRLVSGVSKLPYVAEMHSGTWHGYHYDKGTFRPSDCEFSWCNIIGAGAAGWNWYMLHDRDNWYMSPLNSSGRSRHELVEVMRRCVAAEEEIRPWTWTRRSKTAITYHHLHHAMTHGNTDDQTSTQRTGQALYDAGIDYTFFSLDQPTGAPEILFYDGGDWLPETGYDVLDSYMEEGGHLVVFQTLPRRDASGAITDPLQIRPPDGIDSQGYMNTFFRDIRISLGTEELTLPLPSATYTYGSTPGSPLAGTLIRSAVAMNDNIIDEYQRLVTLGDGIELTIGYTEERGAGSLTVVGLAPSPDLIVAIHRYLDVAIPALPQSIGVQTALYSGDSGTHYLVALNNGLEERIAEISVDLNGSNDDTYRVRSVIGSGARDGIRQYVDHDLDRVSVRLDGKSGTILEISSANVRGPR